MERKESFPIIILAAWLRNSSLFGVNKEEQLSLRAALQILRRELERETRILRRAEERKNE